MASSGAAGSNPLFGVQVSKKLSKTNHVVWHTQVLVIMCGARLEDHVIVNTSAPPAEKVERSGDTITKTPNQAFEE
ncbi:hypothetical protein ACP70R_002884 [Stipagrostis hirtigluma subsp. patula]